MQNFLFTLELYIYHGKFHENYMKFKLSEIYFLFTFLGIRSQ